MSKFMELVEEIVKEGIAVTLCLNKEENKIYADLGFRAKSHGYLYETEVGLEVRGRYDDATLVDDLNDVLSCFLDAFRMRDFGSPEWLALAEKRGYIKKKVTITTTVSYE